MTPGTRLGVFEIAAQIGRGGMGEVYRARDTRLNRDVAIKILPPAFGSDPDRLVRFRREAQVLASLNHPNIASIHGIEESGGICALVLELIEGPTLADRLASGLIPASDALPVARQIAEALQAAHARGIVHRDLKPANIKLRPDGLVKVLDFGLAKAIAAEDVPAPGAISDLTTRPTPGATERGVILGTAAYMSPEQARGEAVDHQADIWAFGCVVYEMLTGRRAFEGRTTSDTMAAVLRADPDWTALPPGLHPRVRLMLERCLEKKTADRYHSIADIRVDVQKAASTPGQTPASRPRPRARVSAWALAAAIVAGIAGVAGGWLARPVPVVSVERYGHVLPADQAFSQTSSGHVAISPDGASIVYVANDALFLRPIDRVEAHPIPGTRGAPANPFFSSDGASIGYHDFRLGELRRIAVSGGTPLTLARVTNLFGATWNADGTILFGQEDGIWRIPAAGGTPEQLVAVRPGERVHGPRLLPGGDAVLFTLRTESGARQWQNASLVVQSLNSDERHVVTTGRDGRYLPSGHLVYGLRSTLFAVAFDPATWTVRGAPVAMVEGVREPMNSPGTTGTANYDVSDSGTLVYVAAEDSPRFAVELVRVDRRGNATPIVPEKRPYWRPRVSPVSSQIAVELTEDRLQQIWLVDADTGAASPLTSGRVLNDFAAWSPDGQSIFYRSLRPPGQGIYRLRIDGRSEPERIHSSPEDLIPGDVSRGGILVFAAGEQTGRRGIFTLPLAGGQAAEFLATPALEHMPLFSPDGRWIAYVSTESGRSEVYIRSYPHREESGRRVSEHGGVAPVWARDGSELFYRNEAGMLVAVPVRLGASVTLGRATELFQVEGRFRTSGNAAAYDVDASGRFVMVTAPDRPPPFARQIVIVRNWVRELRTVGPGPGRVR